MPNSSFSSRSFWISYVLFALLAQIICRWLPWFDAGGLMLVTLATIIPVPFFLSGYFAHSVGFSVLYALIVLVVSILFCFFVIPLLGHLFDPS